MDFFDKLALALLLWGLLISLLMLFVEEQHASKLVTITGLFCLLASTAIWVLT